MPPARRALRARAVLSSPFGIGPALSINLRQLQYFARVVEHGNMTRAAEQLYVAQQALGLQIRLLEDELGVALLRRHSRGVVPTRAGRLLYERACELLRLTEATGREVMAAGRHDREGIVLGLTNGFANIVGRDLVLASRRDLPDVTLSIVEERSVVLLEGLERHEIDIALAYEVHERPGLLRVPLLDEETLFVSAPHVALPAARKTAGRTPTAKVPPKRRAPPRGVLSSTPSALKPPIPFSALAHFPLVMPGVRDGVRQQVLATAKRLAVPLEVMLDVSSVSLMRNLIANGDAAAVMPYGNVVEDIAQGRIAGRRIVDPPLKRTLYLVRAARRAPFKYEDGVLELVAHGCLQFCDALGDLATPLDALASGRLAAALSALEEMP
jgi:LysR family nitrogen assimilation transcriptional regulator